VLVALVAWNAWSVAPTKAGQGLDVALRATPSGELAVDPAKGNVLEASLKPGGEARGLLHLRNLTGRRVVVRPRIDGVDSTMRVTFSRRGQAATTFRLAPGELAGVRVRVAVPEDAPVTSLGRSTELTLGFDTQLAR
jgi:hypothetical protein